MERIRNLRSDQGGAILIIGVFMASFLVGVLWYIIGLGDAAVYREYMQDGADAATFAAAVYQARGMNIIALMNLIMAAVLAVLVALKIAEALLVLATGIVCVIAAFALPLEPVCISMGKGVTKLHSVISKVEPAVDKILKAMYVAESAVAVGMPWIAEAKAVAVAKDYGPTVHGGFMVGISLVPGHLTKYLGELASGGGEDEEEPEDHRHVLCKDGKRSPTCKCVRANYGGCCSHHGGIQASSDGATKYKCEDPPEEEPNNENAGVRWGLPVEDDDFDVLCKKATDDVSAIVFLPFSFLNGVGDKVEEYGGSFLSKITNMFKGYFCGGGGVDMSSVAETVCSDPGSSAQAEIDKSNQNKEEGAEKNKFDKDECIKKFNETASQMGVPGETEVGKKVTKRVYSEAIAGDNYFASWSFVWGDLKSQSSAQQGVDVAAWGQATTEDPGFFGKIHFARSEFYYEPREKDADKSWEGLKDEAMWRMRWRARLRRTYMPSYKLSSVFAGQVDKIKEKLGNADLVDQVLEIVGDPVKKIEQIDDKIGEMTGNVNEGIIH